MNKKVKIKKTIKFENNNAEKEDIIWKSLMYSNNSNTVLTYFHGQDSPKDKIEEIKRLMRFNYALLSETRDGNSCRIESKTSININIACQTCQYSI